MARDFSNVTGVPLGIAVAKAIDDAEKLTGEDYTHWKLALPARTDEKPIPHLNATKLGALINLSVQDTNRLLESSGLQIKSGNQWRLTTAGKQHGEEYPYDRNGHSDYRILWRDSVADAVKGGKNVLINPFRGYVCTNNKQPCQKFGNGEKLQTLERASAFV